jgi:mannose-1-phosphate guanylyltransferase
VHADRQTGADPEVAGFCLAAGRGTRLAPLTDHTPKPLLAPAGRPLLDLALEALGRAGAGRIVVNAHAHAGALSGHLAGRTDVTVVTEPELLGTGGGLGNARRLGLLAAPVVLVTCADIVVDPADLATLVRALNGVGAGGGAPAAVVGLVPAGPDDPLPFALGPAGAVAPGPGAAWASAGVYALRGELLDTVPDGYSSLVASVLRPLWEAGRLAGVPLAGAWADAGTRERFLDLAAGLLAGRWPYELPAGRRNEAGVFVASGAEAAPDARLTAPVVLDRGVTVGPGARLERVVAGPGAVIGAGAVVTGSVLGPGASIPRGAVVDGALVAGDGYPHPAVRRAEP